jgi:tRNA modification GTPase
MAEADLVLVVIDAADVPHAEDDATVEALRDRPVLVAANKIDLANPERIAQVKAPFVRTSALTGEGIPELRRAIVEAATLGAPSTETALVTNLRQSKAITKALAALDKAGEASANGIPHEMILLDLYEALGSLDALTGTTTTDDILWLIFSSFCIGK